MSKNEQVYKTLEDADKILRQLIKDIESSDNKEENSILMTEATYEALKDFIFKGYKTKSQRDKGWEDGELKSVFIIGGKTFYIFLDERDERQNDKYKIVRHDS